MSKYYKLNLQLFADGGGTGDGGAAPAGEGGGAAIAGVNAADPARRLEELGVPQDKIKSRHRAKPVAASVPAAKVQQDTVNAATEGQAAADTNAVTEEPKETAPTRMTWEEIMADPEYNKSMQQTVANRLRSAKGAEEMLDKLAPLIEAVGARHGIDASDRANLDIDALLRAVNEDPSYYEAKADELGTTTEMARNMSELERLRKEKEERNKADFMAQKRQEHFQKISQEAAMLKAKVPSFDLMKEMQNPRFAAMTGPGSLLSVEDAYFAIHRQELLNNAQQSAMQEAERKLASVRQKNAARPVENGASSQGASIGSMDYGKMSKDQRKAFKQDLQERWNRGERVLPR